MIEALKKNKQFIKRPGPVVLVIMDGVGIGSYEEGDAVREARMPTLRRLLKTCPNTRLRAHGTAVGLPSDKDMGNSEVGHNAIGCGRVYDQGAKLVTASIETGTMFAGETWKKITANAIKNKGTLHFIGLLSDGNVHSHIDHLKAMILRAKEEGVRTVRIHGLLDGRDVGETSALDYFDPFDEFCRQENDSSFDVRIASGGGRMVITMDRYNANWDMVRKGWEVHVRGKGRMFSGAHDAIVTLREETDAIDQDLPPFVIGKDGQPVGPIVDGDSVVYFNFRGDRALEITKAFEAGDDFSEFDRGQVPKVEYAGMMEYDGDLHVPRQYLVSPPSIQGTMSEYLSSSGVRQYAISETQKYGHVTYFFNGNRTGKFSETLETYEEVLSDVVPFEQRPWMKCAEITDKTIKAIESGSYDFIRLNYPNGDMVGHTGIYQAVVCAMEAVDICLNRLEAAVRKAGGVMVISADHGNSDDMYEHDKKTGEVLLNSRGQPKAKTSHSLNPVPCILVDSDYKEDYSTTLREGLGISSLAATCMELLGYLPPDNYDPGVLIWE